MMADENGAPTGDGEELRPEGGAEQEAPEIKEGSEASEEAVTPESLAAELGWSPKDKWRGNPDDWKPASQFLKDTVNVNKTQRRELKSMSDKLDRITRTTATIVERTRAEERAKWEKTFNDAVEEGDKETAKRATNELNKLDAAHDEPSGSNSAVTAFVERNSAWFDVDPVATAMAHAVATQYARKNASPEEQVEAAERAVRQRFPEYFSDDKPRGSKPPAEVAEQRGRTARSTTSSREKGFADLPADAKAVALKFEKQGVKKEEFAKEYWKENA